MDNTTLNKWRKFVDEHKPAGPCFDPEVAATLLAKKDAEIGRLKTPVAEGGN